MINIKFYQDKDTVNKVQDEIDFIIFAPSFKKENVEGLTLSSKEFRNTFYETFIDNIVCVIS